MSRKTLKRGVPTRSVNEDETMILPNNEDETMIIPHEDLHLKLTIDTNEKQYSSLTNSNITGNYIEISEEYSQSCVQFMQPEDVNYRPAYPGVGGGSFLVTDTTVTGYLRISPSTVKPFEITRDASVIYWILSGEVIVRSTAFVTREDVNYAHGKSLKTGACIVVPCWTPYTIENRQVHTNALLGYVIISEPSPAPQQLLKKKNDFT